MSFRTLLDFLKPGRSLTPNQWARRGAPRRQPAACRLAVETLEDRSVPASLAVSDVMLLEGNDDTQNAAVTVSLSAPSNRTVTVNYGTSNGTATAGSDYSAVSGKLTFARGETNKTILVPVCGDRLAEPDETFFVKLMGARNSRIADAQGTVTIVDEDPRLSTISINDVEIWEGNSGTALMTFTVSLAAAYDQAVTVNYATLEGAVTADQSYLTVASAGQDYLATSGTLTFAPGETTKTITVEIIGDPYSEFNEMFVVNLSGASANALIIDHQGFGTIMDDLGWINTDYGGGYLYDGASYY